MQKLFLDPLEVQLFESIDKLRRLWIWKLTAESLDPDAHTINRNGIIESLNVARDLTDYESLYQSLIERQLLIPQQSSAREKSEEGLLY